MVSVRLVASLLLLGLTFVVCTEVDETPSLVPMFLWSKTNSFVGHSSVSESLQSPDISSLITNLLNHKLATQSKMSSYVNKAEAAPEVLIAFLYPQLSSSEASRLAGGYSSSSSSPSFLQSALKESRSSLSVPFVLTPSSLRHDIITVISSNSPHAVLYSASEIGPSDSSLTGCDAILNHLQEDPTIFSNGITDLLLIPYDHTKDTGSCMDRLVSLVDQKTSGKFVALVSADQAAAKPIQMVFFDGTENPHLTKSSMLFSEFAVDSRPTSGSGKFQVSATSGYAVVTYVGVQYVTSTTMVALFLAFFMVFVIYTGATCVMYIETPVRYSTTPLQLAKEY